MTRGVRFARRLARADRGGVYVEFLIAFLPILLLFLGVCQIIELRVYRMLARHAAFLAVRTGAVVISGRATDPSAGPDGALSAQREKAIYSVINSALEPWTQSAARPRGPIIPQSGDSTVSIIWTNGSPQAVISSPFHDPGDAATMDELGVKVSMEIECTYPVVRTWVCGTDYRRTFTVTASYKYPGTHYQYEDDVAYTQAEGGP